MLRVWFTFALSVLLFAAISGAIDINSHTESPSIPNLPHGLFKSNDYYSSTPKYDTDKTQFVIQRLDRLERDLNDNVGKIRRELYEKNRRAEYERNITRSDFDGVLRELERILERQRREPPVNPAERSVLERRIERLSTMVKVMLGNMRILNADVANIRTNLTGLVAQTASIMESNKNLLTLQIFDRGLMELRHGHNQYRVSSCDESKSTKDSLPGHCKELKASGKSTGIYRIKPESAPSPFMVYCDMDSRDGGWTVIQNRFDGSQDFYRDFHDYKYGFGNLAGEFWLGLENIFYMTGHEVNELLIELEDSNSATAYARYAAFSIGPELEGYALKVLGGYAGNAGDSLKDHAGNRFSTRDVDRDAWPEGSCAMAHGGGWWYRNCDTSNLNGRYLPGKLPEQFIYQGMYWADFNGPLYSLSKARMLIRPKDDRNSELFFSNPNTNLTFDDY